MIDVLDSDWTGYLFLKSQIGFKVEDISRPEPDWIEFEQDRMESGLSLLIRLDRNLTKCNEMVCRKKSFCGSFILCQFFLSVFLIIFTKGRFSVLKLFCCEGAIIVCFFSFCFQMRRTFSNKSDVFGWVECFWMINCYVLWSLQARDEHESDRIKVGMNRFLAGLDPDWAYGLNRTVVWSWTECYEKKNRFRGSVKSICFFSRKSLNMLLIFFTKGCFSLLKRFAVCNYQWRTQDFSMGGGGFSDVTLWWRKNTTINL